jgi:T5SS/PEP-CTERM-associated repeat protein
MVVGIPLEDPGSALSVAGEIDVGAWGQGDLTIANGGQVTARRVFIGGFEVNPDDFDTEMMEAIGTVADGTGTVTVTSGGSLTVSDAHTLVVGGWGTGTLTVEQGGTVTADQVTIGGYDPGFDTLAEYLDPEANLGAGTGTVIVTGDESSLTTDDLDVGFSGDGTLTVEDGAQVTASNLLVGVIPGAVGTVDVNDADVTVTEDMAVGIWGDGDVTIENGAQVSAREVFIGGASWDWLEMPEDLDHEPNGTGTVTVTGEDSLLDVAVGDTIYVGYSGTGTLNVLDGGRVETDAVLVGVTEDGVGLVNVDGAGSTLQITGVAPVTEGVEGDGEVIISNGGAVVVDQPFGVLNVAGNITVGSEGEDSTLTVSNGGNVYSERGIIGGYDPEFDDITEYFDPETELSDGTGTATITGENSSWTPDNLMVGFSGDGTLNVEDGGFVGDFTSLIGMVGGVTGTANVSGTDSTWVNLSDLVVGAWGTGYLTISDGGQVWASDAYIGGMPMEVLEAEDDPDYTPTGTGTVTVTGPDSQFLVGAVASLYVGYSGTGTLNVEDGGYVESQSAGVAALPGSTGTVVVDGIHSEESNDVYSEWDNSGSMFVGGYGNGSLMISNGGGVITQDSFYIGGFNIDDFDIDVDAIGYDPNGVGTVTVTGDESYLGTGGLAVGTTGTGTLNILDGGWVDSTIGLVGFGPDSNGEVTVDGCSTWYLSDEVQPLQVVVDDSSILGVGVYGQGRLTISNGGEVDVADAVIGGFDLGDIDAGQYYDLWGVPNGNGSVVVTGQDSWLDVLDHLCVGYSGTGSLTIEDGGRVVSEYGYVGQHEDADGTVLITGDGSRWSVDEDLYIGGNDGGSGGTGLVTVTDGGELVVGGELYVWDTGTLAGDGTVTVAAPTTLHNYGTIAPGGDAIGTLTVNGDVVFEAGSTFSVQIANSDNDLLDVDGNVTISDEDTSIQVLSQGTIIGTHDYEIMRASSIGGEFNDLDTALLSVSITDPNVTYEPGDEPNSIWLHVVAANFADPNIACNYNQQQVGGALQQIAAGGGNDITDDLQDLADLRDVRRAYDQLNGHHRATLGPLTAAGSTKFLGMVTSRLRNVQGTTADMFSRSSLFAMAGPDTFTGGGRTYDVNPQSQAFGVGRGSKTMSDSQWGLWGRGYGLYGDSESGEDMEGYNYTIYGGSVGLDYQFSEAWLGGLVAGMSDGDVDYAHSRDNTEFQAKHLGLYASGAWEKWYLDVVGTYAMLDYDTERFVDLLGERLTASFNGNEAAAYVEVGRNWYPKPDLKVQPLVSLQYTYVGIDPYTEAGGIGALKFDKQTYESTKGSLGARLTRTLVETMGDFRADVQLRGRWVHEFGDSRGDVDVAFADTPAVGFNVRDNAVSRDSAILGAGVYADLTDSTRIYVDYDTRFNSDESVQVIGAALQHRW